MKTLHMMGTQHALNAAVRLLRRKYNEEITYNHRTLVGPGYEELGKIVDATMQIHRDDDFSDDRRRVLYVVHTLHPAFCWELVNEQGRRARGDDGDFTLGENMDTILAGRLLFDLSIPSIALRYELAVERIRPARSRYGELHNALRIALGQLAMIEWGQRDPMEAQIGAIALAGAKWDEATTEMYEARNIVFSALAHTLGDWISEHYK
jgi:hypothetical protein